MSADNAAAAQDPGAGNEFVPGKRKGRKSPVKAAQQLAAESSGQSLGEDSELTTDGLP